jgi:hypothetical protein
VLLKQDKHAVMNRSRGGRYNQRSARNRLARFWLFPTEDWVTKLLKLLASARWFGDEIERFRD